MQKSKSSQPATMRENSNSAFVLDRRLLLQSVGALLACTFLSKAAFAGEAQKIPVADFLKLSCALTGYSDLSPITARRIQDALAHHNPAFITQSSELFSLTSPLKSVEDNMAAINAEDLKAAALSIIAAWYTGTVKTDDGPVVVAYEKALMYRPVSDGLIVPTYGSKGPLYWKDSLPPGVSRMPETQPSIL
ncbi:sugar dehydrogenase complex small subunit [Bartonella sp. LJL80]